MQETGIKLVVIGVSYRKTTLGIRNKFALTTENITSIYRKEKYNLLSDFFILSTCNRTELYCISDHIGKVIDMFSRYTRIDENEARKYTFVKSGAEAIRHLFHVASGLDSQIVGDYEIIGQLKNAFALAKANNCVSGLMEKLVNSSVQASRQVRSRTSISDGTTSISYAVIQLLKQDISDNHSRKICLMGLGKMGTLTLKNLKHYLPQHQVALINRSEMKAESVAKEYQVDFVKLEERNDVIQNSDVLIVATGADHPVITKGEIESSNVKLIFDLSVPSNVSRDVKEIVGLKMYDIDGLSQIVNKTIEKRENQIPLAEQIIEEHFQEFRLWEKRREMYLVKAES